MTVKEIKEELDALGIEYDSKARKEDLMKLLKENTATKEEIKAKKYVVIYDFRDLKDKGYVYIKGDIYPREGKQVDEDRVKELMSTANKIGKPLIKEQD